MEAFTGIGPGDAVAFDFETLYDSKSGYSLKKMHPYDYVRHPRFDPYLVALESHDGQRYVGSPLAFDWGSVAGALLVAHNVGFDGMVLDRLVELGRVPGFSRGYACTADLIAFLGCRRDLKSGVRTFLGVEISKAVRTAMDGKTLADLTPSEKSQLLAYGGDDARYCMALWKKLSPQWPEWEREFSRVNRLAVWRGVRIDRRGTVDGLAKFAKVKAGAEARLPWVSRGRPAESTAELALHAQSLGLPLPPTFNKQDPAMQAWIEQYSDRHEFIRARLDVASVTKHIARLQSMLELADAADVIRFDSLYYGSHTGRTSGKGGGDAQGGARFNVFNQPKGDKNGLTFGVDVRGLLVPRPGHKFVIYDYSQIEPRCTHWVAGNTRFLNRVRAYGDDAGSGRENIYQAAAKVLGWYPESGTALKKENAKLYQLAKACLAPETLVLTNRGYKRIVDVSLNDMVWDGSAWVMHEGVICNGYRDDIVTVNGERFTRDHRVYFAGWRTRCAGAFRSRLAASSLAWRSSLQWAGTGDSLWALACGVWTAIKAEYRDAKQKRLRRRMLVRKLRTRLLSPRIKSETGILYPLSHLRNRAVTGNTKLAEMGSQS